MILVDSSAWIHSLRPDGDTAVREQVEYALRSGEAVWCEMIKLELWNGARGVREKRVLREMEQAISLVSTTSEVWERSFSLARLARKKGQTIPASDLLIFACARTHGAAIIHADKHLSWLEKHWE